MNESPPRPATVTLPGTGVSSHGLIPYPLPKRIVDKVVAGALLVLLSPVLLVVLLALALDLAFSPADRGSVFSREARISRGRTFQLLKFRTSRADGADLTWAGRRLLRPWYLDELPQLFNVLRGDISLVGPRPWPPEMVERQVGEGHDYRLRVIAGLTGPAQVTKGLGRSYSELDEEYVERSRSLGGSALALSDLGILVQTLKVVARGEGLSY